MQYYQGERITEDELKGTCSRHGEMITANTILVAKPEGNKSLWGPNRRWEGNIKPKIDIVTDLINALPGNSSVNTAQHETIEEAVFSVHPTDAPVDWLDSDHVI
jgi:hypothetical protein